MLTCKTAAANRCRNNTHVNDFCRALGIETQRILLLKDSDFDMSSMKRVSSMATENAIRRVRRKKSGSSNVAKSEIERRLHYVRLNYIEKKKSRVDWSRDASKIDTE